jgi:hypothetical protein
MSNESPEIYDWIVKIIDTCKTPFHFDAVDRLIALYYEREKDEAKMIELNLMKKQKWNEIHFILE